MKKSLVNVGYAPITEQTKDGTTYGTPVYFDAALAGGREYSMSPSGDSKTIYANSQQVYLGEENDGYEISLTLIDIIDDIRENWLGDTIAENGRLEKVQDSERPRFALILSDRTTDGVGTTEILYNCIVSERPEISGETAEEGSWSEQFPEYTIKASPRPSDNYIRFTIDGVEELTAIPEPTITSA